MHSLNLRGEPPAAEEPEQLPSEEPLGLDLIRAWFAKPRPLLHRLWLWVPHTAKGVRKAYGWIRANAGPAMRRAAEQARRAAAVAQAFRGVAKRLADWLRTAFPPGSRGREFAVHLLEANRGLGRAIFALLGIGRDLDRASRLLPREEAPPEGSRQPGSPPAAPESDPEPSPRTASESDPEPSPRTAPEDEAASPGRILPRSAGRGREESPRKEGPVSETRRRTPADSQPAAGAPPGPRAAALEELPKSLRVLILTLGKRPRRNSLRFAIWRIVTECGPATSERLGLLLAVDPANLAKRHLSPMVEDGVLKRTIPDRLNHPEQAYRPTGRPPG